MLPVSRLSYDRAVWIWGLAVSLAYLPGVMPAPVLGRQIIVAVGVGLLCRWRAPWWLMVWLGLVLAWGAVSLWWSPDLLTGQGELIWWTVLGGVLVTASSWDRDDLDSLLAGLSWGLVLPLPLLGWQLSGSLVLPQISVPAGLWQSREVMGELAGLLAAWAFASRRWLALALALVIALAQSRIGLAAAAIGPLWEMRLWMKLVVGGLLLAGVWALSGAEKLATGSLRLADWRTGWELLLGAWPWGTGLGFVRGASPLGQWIHSDGLQIGLELGAAGLGLALALVLGLALVLESSLVPLAAALALEASVSSVLRLPASGLVAAATVGCLVGRCQLVWRGAARGRAPRGLGPASGRLA